MGPLTLLHLLPLLLPAAPAAPRPVPAAPPVVIAGVTVIDATGAASRADMTVSIRDGRIAGIDRASDAKPVPNAQVIEARGKFLIPGLWDMHVHLSWTKASALPVLVANGVTGVRDMGGRLSELDEWRR